MGRLFQSNGALAEVSFWNEMICKICEPREGKYVHRNQIQGPAQFMLQCIQNHDCLNHSISTLISSIKDGGRHWADYLPEVVCIG